jgi:hypothetical protein
MSDITLDRLCFELTLYKTTYHGNVIDGGNPRTWKKSPEDHWKTVSLKFVSNLLRHEREWANLQTLVILDTDCYWSNYHMITVPMF